MENSTNLPRSRNQRGVNPSPVLMRLSDDELNELKLIADAECSSLSRIARQLFIAGLTQYKSSINGNQTHSTNVEC